MRDITAFAEGKLKSRMQAGDGKLQTSLWVSRPNVPLTNPIFLERQQILSGGTSRVSIAVAHTQLSRSASFMYIAYIQGGVLRIKTAEYRERMDMHEWTDVDFSKQATDVSICFDGTMPKSLSGQLEFITESDPWVFWIHNGALYGQKLNTNEVVVLAESNCQAVSAVRATWSDVNAFNFGLVVFFILNGNIYYRQLFNGEWTDAELVNFGPSGVSWEDLSATRTWDYRIVLQVRSTTGVFYELFTQYMGIGTRSSEHFQVNGAKFEGNATGLKYHTFKHKAEHIVMEKAYNAAPYGGIYELGIPSLLDIYNVPDQDENWGKMIVFEFDKELNPDSIEASIACFYIVDSWGVRYYPSSITMDRTGRKATLHFIDFNNAHQECTGHYVPGFVVTMVDEVLAECSMNFTPKNLVPGDISFPEVVDMWSNDKYGREIAIKFSEPIVTIASGSENGFIVTVPEYDYVPEGNLSDVVKPVVSVEGFSGMGEEVNLESGSSNGLIVSNGVLSLGVLSNE